MASYLKASLYFKLRGTDAEMQHKHRKKKRDAGEEKEPASRERGRVRDQQDRNKQRCFPCSLWSMMTRAPLTSSSDRPVTLRSFLFILPLLHPVSAEPSPPPPSSAADSGGLGMNTQLFEERGDLTAKHSQLQFTAATWSIRIRPQSWIKEVFLSELPRCSTA